jgi:protein phosphatase PTC7
MQDTYLPPDGSKRDSQSTHLAISDGVGGWSDTVDPSFFSQGLMYHYGASARGEGPASAKASTPLDHLRNAYNGVLSEKIVVAGGATACGVSLNARGELMGVK